jgi:hypothetical protein
MAGYCMEKTHQAISILATGRGRINDRLFDAFLAFAALSPESFPEGEARETYRKFYERITAVKAKGSEGDVKATLHTISEDEGAELAQLLLSLEYELEIALGRT